MYKVFFLKDNFTGWGNYGFKKHREGSLNDKIF